MVFHVAYRDVGPAPEGGRSLELQSSTGPIRVTKVGDTYHLDATPTARIVVSADLRVHVERVAGAAQGDMEELLRRTVMPILHQLRGVPAFHASAVVLGGGAVGLLGRSGSGKSTLALLAARLAGAPLLTDDCLVLERAGRGWRALPESNEVRVRAPTSAALALPEGKLIWNGKVAVEVPHLDGPIPLRALVLLAESPTPQFGRLSRRDAIAQLATHLYRIDPSRDDLLRGELTYLEELAGNVPVARFGYPRNYAAAQQTVAALRASLESPLS